jgi:hypothetical protein
VHDVVRFESREGCGGANGINLNGSDLWTDDKWKSKWLQRLETRVRVSFFYFCLFLLLNDKFIIGSESCYTA